MLYLNLVVAYFSPILLDADAVVVHVMMGIVDMMVVVMVGWVMVADEQ